jgi:hypothetical protein
LTILDLATQDEFLLFHHARQVGDLHSARDAMIGLLRDGHVEIRVRPRTRWETERTLDRVEAEQALQSDANWFDPIDLLTPVFVLVAATESGAAVYRHQMNG